MSETVHIAGLGGGLEELTALSDEGLAERIVALALSLRAPGPDYYAPLSVASGLPLGEILASPFSLRAVAMAVDVGASAIHHDIRRVIPWAAELRGHADVISEGHGQWSAGVLEAGKYEAFLQEEPLSVYNPNHMSKWGPHELLHRVCRFFWRGDMSRWELYLGARLNEVVPVVHWYGMDEILRLDREGFSTEVDTAAPNATLERAEWLGLPEAELLERARAGVTHFQAGLAHFRREMAAIETEIATGQRVRIEDDVLDSSSDATAYVVGHWTRLNRPGMHTLCSDFLELGRDYYDDVKEYLQVVSGVFQSLLCDRLELDLEVCSLRFRRRLAWDALTRTTLVGPVGEWAISELADRSRSDGASRPLAVDEAGLSDLQEGLQTILAEANEAEVDGWQGDFEWVEMQGVGDGADLEQLGDGVNSICPATLQAFGDLGDERAFLRGFANSEGFRLRGALAGRLRQFVASRQDLDQVGALTALIDLELALAAPLPPDDQVERLGILLVDQEPEQCDWVRPNSGFRVLTFDYDVLPLHYELLVQAEAARWPEKRATSCLMGLFLGEISVIPAPPNVLRAWESLRQAPVTVERLLELLEPDETDTSDDGYPDSADGWAFELRRSGAIGITRAL